MTDLGALSGTDSSGNASSSATAINANGQVVGTSAVYDSQHVPHGRHAFLYSNGQMTDLGTLGGTDSTGSASSFATAINAGGQVVGYSDVYDAQHNYHGAHAFLYSGGQMTDLGGLGTDGSGSSTSSACAINASGQVIGTSGVYDAQHNFQGQHAFLYSGGQMTDLNAAVQATLITAPALTDNGQIAGLALFNSLTENAYLITPAGPRGYSLVVNTTTDEDNGSPDPTLGTGTSLREAVSYADQYPGTVISFDATVFGTKQTLALTLGPLSISAAMIITGPSAGVALDGNHLSRVFTVTGGSASSPVMLSRLTLQNGTASDSSFPGNSGGGLYLSSGTAVLTNCVFTGNSAGSEGGGFYNDHGTATLTNCTLSGNSAPYGGGLANNGGTTTLTGDTLTGNSATTRSGGFENNGAASLTDDILYGDTAPAAPEIYDFGGTTTTAGDCDIQGGYPGTGNLSADPLFVGAPADLHLQAGSPCRGAGIAVRSLTLDKDGATRASPPSIGAYEFVPPPATTVTVPGVSGAVGQTVALSATLKTAAGAAVSAQTVTFSLDGTTLGTAVTASNGAVARLYTVPLSFTPGSAHAIGVSFAGDAADPPAAGTGTLTVSASATTLTVNPVSGAPGKTVILTATLKRTAGGAAVGGETVSFSVDGTAVGTGVTNSSGTATRAFVIPAAFTVGSHQPHRVLCRRQRRRRFHRQRDPHRHPCAHHVDLGCRQRQPRPDGDAQSHPQTHDGGGSCQRQAAQLQRGRRDCGNGRDERFGNCDGSLCHLPLPRPAATRSRRCLPGTAIIWPRRAKER